MAKPGAADDYFLTTLQNTFFSLTFDVAKKQIVHKKQGGETSADMWVAYWLSDKNSLSADELLTERSKYPDWATTIAGLEKNTNCAVLLKALAAKDEPAEKIVLNNIVLHKQMLSAPELLALRENNASNKEVLACALLATTTHSEPVNFLLQVQGKVKTWDDLITNAGIDITKIEQTLIATYPNINKG